MSVNLYSSETADSLKAARERAARQVLRRFTDHLQHVLLRLGAQQEAHGMVDVFYHPDSAAPALNYITPRRSTAWVGKNMALPGLERLAALGRVPRFLYIEGLYPPQFGDTLADLGLEPESSKAIMAYVPAGIADQIPPPVGHIALPDGVTAQCVSDHRAMEHWWYVWRNAHYDVLTLGAEPLLIGRDMAALGLGQQIDFVLYRYGFPVGVARVSLVEGTAHLLALALLAEMRSPAMLHMLQFSAVKGALEAGAEVVFAPGVDEAERRLTRKLGFVDLGRVVCYAAADDTARGNDERSLGLSVLAF